MKLFMCVVIMFEKNLIVAICCNFLKYIVCINIYHYLKVWYYGTSIVNIDYSKNFSIFDAVIDKDNYLHY